MKLLKEPLLHFLVAGALLFAAYSWLNNGSGGTAIRQVLIGKGEVNWLKQTWARQWQREAGRARGLVKELLKEELSL